MKPTVKPPKTYNLQARVKHFIPRESYWCELILYKGSGKNTVLYCIKVTGKDKVALVNKMVMQDKIKRLQVKFSIETKLYQKKYYTSLLLREIKEWRKYNRRS